MSGSEKCVSIAVIGDVRTRTKKQKKNNENFFFFVIFFFLCRKESGKRVLFARVLQRYDVKHRFERSLFVAPQIL